MKNMKYIRFTKAEMALRDEVYEYAIKVEKLPHHLALEKADNKAIEAAKLRKSK